MKNNAIAHEGRPLAERAERAETAGTATATATATAAAPAADAGVPAPSLEWREALLLLDADLRRRGAAERTRRAYAFDAGQFAQWCGAQDVAPAEVTTRVLRRYAAALGQQEVVAATVARKLAALRSLYRTLREHGRVAQNPAD